MQESNKKLTPRKRKARRNWAQPYLRLKEEIADLQLQLNAMEGDARLRWQEMRELRNTLAEARRRAESGDAWKEGQS